MIFCDIASSLRAKCIEMENLVSDLKNLSFNTVFSGSVYEFMNCSLCDIISKLEIQISNLKNFADNLDALQKYKVNRDKINQLKLQYYNMANSDISKDERDELGSLINTLNVSNTQVRNSIINTISQYNLISSEVDIIKCDLLLSNSIKFHIDLDSLNITSTD